MKLHSILTCSALTLAAVALSSTSVSADLIYLRGKGQSKATVVRGTVAPLEDGRMEVITSDGKKQVVPEGDIVAVIAEGAPQDNLPQNHRRTGEADGAQVKGTSSREGESSAGSREATPSENTAKQGSDTASATTSGKGAGSAANAGTAVADGGGSGNAAKSSGFWSLKPKNIWIRNDGQGDVTRTIVKVEQEGARTIVHEEMKPERGKTIVSQIIIEQRGEKTIYQRRMGNQSPETVLVEPLVMGTEWTDKDGLVWKVVETGLNYTDVGNNRHSGCVKVQAHDAATAKPVPGSVQVFAPKVGRVNNGLLRFSEGNE